MSGRVDPRAAYRNDLFPERRCDCCNKLYRGPAIYCSLDCALADAGDSLGQLFSDVEGQVRWPR